MTERTANYGRARRWLCSPNGRHHLLPVCPTSPGTHGRRPPGQTGRKDTWKDIGTHTCGLRESRLWLPLPFPDVSELEAAQPPEAGIEAQRGPWLGYCHSASLNLNPATAVHPVPSPVFLAPALGVAELNNFPRPFFGSVR